MWLLESNVLERLDKATRMHGGDFPEREDLAAVSKRAATVASNGVAVIEVEGILTKMPDPFVRFFYGANTAYDDIIAQIAAAESDNKVQSIRFEVDSPGGNVDGLFDTLAAIEGASKPMSVVARNAQSAAYGIAAAAGNITATGPGAMFGSVGTAISVHVDEHVVTLTSSNAPEKRPDPRTEEGRTAIVRHLDAIDDLFVGAIAQGRGTSADSVRQNYGRGASILAGEAKKRGMIDSIAGAGLRVVEQPKATADGGSEACMDLEQLKAEHPAVYKAAVEVGVRQERERAEAHLKLAETGDLATALEAIKSGDDLTQKIYAAHMAAALNRRDRKSREEDDAAVADATENTAEPKKEDSFEKQVADRFLALVGNGDI